MFVDSGRYGNSKGFVKRASGLDMVDAQHYRIDDVCIASRAKFHAMRRYQKVDI